MERHLPEVGKRGGEWRFRCSCGTESLARPTRRMAKADQDEHLQEVSPVPPDEQCRDPKQHRLRPWERCELCSGQISIFDLDTVDDVQEHTMKETNR